METVKKIFEWLYYLIDNAITDPADKIAKVKSHKTKGIDDIAAHIVQARTEYRRETIVNIIKMANAAKLEFLSQGEMVNDGLVIFEPTITGAFHENAEFNGNRNACVVKTHAGNDIHAMLKQVKGVYSGLTVENGGAVITGIADTATGLTTGEVTPGKTVTVTGKKIRVIPEDGETVESCITYTNTVTGQVVQQEDMPVINDPSKIVLQLPMLAEGSYLLTVKTLFTNSELRLKAPRYIMSKVKLEVK